MTLVSNDAESDTDILSKSREKKIQRKQKRLQHMITDDSGIECCDQPSRVNNLEKLNFFMENID